MNMFSSSCALLVSRGVSVADCSPSPSAVSSMAEYLLAGALLACALSWVLVFAVVVGGTVRRGRY